MFSEKLKKLRISHALSQQDIAELLDVGQDAISLYERGKRIPPAKNLLKLADYFDVSVDYLLGREDKEIESSEPSDELCWYFNKLSGEDQAKILEITKSFYKLQQGEK